VEGSGRGLILRYSPGICLEGLRKFTENFSQDSPSPGQYFNPGPPEYEAGVLTTRSTAFGVMVGIGKYRAYILFGVLSAAISYLVKMVGA
jgi:hypothetical protein